MQSQGLGTELLTHLMSATALRMRVIAGNLTNQNTPGFQRRIVRFEELLKEQLNRGPEALRRTEPSVEIDGDAPARADGNNVNLELEMSSLRENQLLFSAYAAIMHTHGEIMRSSILSRGN